jgi:hypothetical protein
MASTTDSIFPTKIESWYEMTNEDGKRTCDAIHIKPIGPGEPYSVDEDGKRVYDTPITIASTMLPAPKIYVPHKPWGSITLSNGSVFLKDQPVPILPSMQKDDYEIALAHNTFVGKNNKSAISKARRVAKEKADEEAVRKEAHEKANYAANIARRVAAHKFTGVQKPIAATGSSIAMTKKISSNIFTALDDSDED